MRRRLLFAFSLALLVAAAAACPGRTDHYQGTQHLLVAPIIAGGTFTSYTETTFSEAIPADKQVYLLDLTVSSNTGEFTWVSTVTGTSPTGQPLVQCESFSQGGDAVSFQVLDSGDIRPLFPDEHTFRMNWDGAFAQSLAQAYPNGVELTFTYTLQIE